MELTNEFHVKVPVERAWAVLTDIETIAPCMPGAALEEIEGDEYRGGVKIKVGPITAQYKGKATFLSKDDANHIAVLKAEGRDTKGQGNASATITATLKPAVRKIEYKPTEPVDLLGTAGAPVVKRAAPAVAILFLLVWLLRRRKKS